MNETVKRRTFISDDIRYAGFDDEELEIFESQYPTEGISYNSYVILDEKIAIMDTVDERGSDGYLAGIKEILGDRKPDYLVIQHMEPDHAANIERLAEVYPDMKLLGSMGVGGMLPKFFSTDLSGRFTAVKEGETLSLGRHTLQFFMAPMVHWPEVMFTYDPGDKVLFSADAFGSFGAIDGSIFADAQDFESEFLSEARRYYTNIVGKYGAQVQMVLKKAADLDIAYICPLHGLVWRKDLDKVMAIYDKWSRYEAEEKGVAIFYGSVYGNSANAAQIMAGKLADKGVAVKVYDMNVKHFSHAVAAAFRFDRILLVTPTVNAEILSSMDVVVRALVSHNIKNRKIAVIDNGTWAPVAGRSIREILGGLKDTTVLEKTLSFKSSVKTSDLEAMDEIVQALI